MKRTHGRHSRRAAVAVHMALATQGACLALAVNAQPADDDAAADEIVVLGRGETRQVQTVTAQQIEQLPAGTSPLKAIEKLPGVNFQAADPYGAYEWSTRITVRGFNQNRMGFTLDGVPLGDMTYGNHNGLHISRAIPTELVDRVVLSQGTGPLDTASDEQPRRRDRVLLGRSGGRVRRRRRANASAATRRGARSSTSTAGELGSGTRSAFAVVDHSTEKWKGAGDQDVRQYNFKLVQPRRRGRAHRVLQLLRPRRDRLSGSVDSTSSRVAATTGTTGTRTGTRRSPQRRPATRAGRTTPSPATTRTGTRPGLRTGRPRLPRARPAVRRLARSGRRPPTCTPQ